MSHTSQQNPGFLGSPDGMALLQVFTPTIRRTDTKQWSRAREELLWSREAALGWSRVGWADRTQSCQAQPAAPAAALGTGDIYTDLQRVHQVMRGDSRAGDAPRSTGHSHTGHVPTPAGKNSCDLH